MASRHLCLSAISDGTARFDMERNRCRTDTRNVMFHWVLSLQDQSVESLRSCCHLQRSVLPSLLAGNTVVLKPAGFYPLTVLPSRRLHSRNPSARRFECWSQDGGDDLGPWMTSHPVTSTPRSPSPDLTRKRDARSSHPPLQPLKHLTLELGGNDPGIVLPDADPQAIAQYLFQSMFHYSVATRGVSPSNAFSCTKASFMRLRKN